MADMIDASTLEQVYGNMPDIPGLPDAYQPRNIAAALKVHRASAIAALAPASGGVEVADRPIFAVLIGERWYIATQADPSEYGLIALEKDRKVWSEDRTTALLCAVGEERKRICLDWGVQG